MKIGFEAKRAFFNQSGLGNYCRNTILMLSNYHPEIQQYLFTPGLNQSLFNPPENTKTIRPKNLWRFAKALWRSKGMSREIAHSNLDIFHGLSHELPIGIENTGTKTIVTIHDLIFLRYPEFYKKSDRIIYERKFRRACQVADLVIAISQQTKQDLIEFFQVPESKIEVVYQSCNPAHFDPLPLCKKKNTREKYHLPNKFLLYVGTIEKRKNLLNLLKAIHEANIDIPLVIVGRQTSYFESCEAYITEHNMLSQVIVLKELDYRDLPALYQIAHISIYPSVFEGFGLPVLESQASGCPVITSNISSMPEAGGDAAVYINPEKPEEIAHAILKINNDDEWRQSLVLKGYANADRFSDKQVADNLAVTYRKLLNKT